MSIASSVFDWRCRRAARLLESREHRRLVAELATYASESDLRELWAMVDRLDEDQTVEVRRILERQQARDLWRPSGAAAGMRRPATI